jgi:hypothetical protein
MKKDSKAAFENSTEMKLETIKEIRKKHSIKTNKELEIVTEYQKYKDLKLKDMIAIEKIYFLKECNKIDENTFNDKKNEILKNYKNDSDYGGEIFSTDELDLINNEENIIILKNSLKIELNEFKNNEIHWL